MGAATSVEYRYYFPYGVGVRRRAPSSCASCPGLHQPQVETQ